MDIYRLYDNNPDLRIIEIIAARLRDGAVIIYPTDSVYAIGCDALNQRAVERIYRYRGQEEQHKPFSIICRDISQADEYTRFSDRQFKVMRRNVPGPFTFVLEAGMKLPKVFRARKTLGIRIPNQPILHALLEELGTPLLTASLKHEGDDYEAGEYMTDPDVIADTFARQADLLIDGGPGLELPSTVVDLTGPEPVVLRPGAGELAL